MLTLTTNEHRTIFVEMNGEFIADSTTFRRARYLNLRHGAGSMKAPGFTEKKIREYGAGLVVGHLEALGVEIPAGTEVVWKDNNGRATSLGVAEAAA